jgi:transposase InsO family protein
LGASPRSRQAFTCSHTRADAYDNALIEAFWARLQTELLDRKKWKTRIELSTALFDYLEIFHNRTRRHSALGMLTPIEFEQVNNQTEQAA